MKAVGVRRNAGRLVRDPLRLSQSRKALERLRLELAHALARYPKPLADLAERLRLGPIEAIAEDNHRPLALGKERERLRQRLIPERVLDPLLRQRILAGDQVPEEGIPLLAERLV